MGPVEIAVPLGFFLTLFGILATFLTVRYLTRKQIHGTIRQAIDKGS